MVKITRKFGRSPKAREKMIRTMVTQVLKHQKIRTTNPKAKEVRRHVERMITLAKEGTVFGRNKALGFLTEPWVVNKLFSEYSQRYWDRNGGYTRIHLCGYRKGDNSQMAILELVGRPGDPWEAAKEAKKLQESQQPAVVEDPVQQSLNEGAAAAQQYS